jgi:hypothetical protein
MVLVVIVVTNWVVRLPLSRALSDPWPSLASIFVALFVCIVLDRAVPDCAPLNRLRKRLTDNALPSKTSSRIWFVLGASVVGLGLCSGVFWGLAKAAQLVISDSAGDSADLRLLNQKASSPADLGRLALVHDEVLLRGLQQSSDITDPASETIRALWLLRSELALAPWLLGNLPVRPGKGQEAWFGLSTDQRRVAPMNWIVGPPFGDVVVFRTRPEEFANQNYGWIVDPNTRQVWAVGVVDD